MGRAAWLAAAALVAALLVVDLLRDPERQWSARALISSIELYQATLAPALGAVGQRCRFVPTCSHYAVDAIREDGALIGAARAIARVARCGPWTPLGTVDPA